MENAVIMIALLVALLVLTIWGDSRRNWLVIIVTTFGWFLLAGWSMTTSAATWDGYFIVGIISILLAIVNCIWPLVTRPKELPPEEDISEEDKAWGGKGRRPPRPPKNRWYIP